MALELETNSGADTVSGQQDSDSGLPATPYCVILVDVDYLASLNDRFGRAVGDEAVKRLAQLFSAVLRLGDSVVRLDGDEFLLLLPSVDLQQAARIAERVQAAVRSMELDLGDLRLGVSVSMGVAQHNPGETRDDLVKRCEAALFEAKSAGRGRVRLAGQ